MRGRALDVRSPEESRDAVAAWLVGRTGLAVEEREDGTLVAFAPSRADAGAVLAELHAAFGGEVRAAARTLPDIAWQERWREGLGPRQIGRLTVTPSWAAAPGGGAHTVVIDPETAFGTGEHASTRTALVLLDRHLRPGDRVLDVGSGSGILAIAAAKLGAVRATGIELDEEAEPVARANAVRNGVAHRVRFVAGFAEALAPLLGPVELVLANILRTTNVALLAVLRAALEPGGIAVFAGMELSERERFLPALAAADFVALDDTVDDGWWAVAARRG
jgi:ribosomal protein L11 methyltransferase